jgi:hypothetical protein
MTFLERRYANDEGMYDGGQAEQAQLVHHGNPHLRRAAD